MDETIKLSPRQSLILNIISSQEGISRDDITEKLTSRYSISKPTLIRELNSLIEDELIRTEGSARSTLYYPSTTNPLLRYIDLENYFLDEPDERKGTKATFNQSIFEHLNMLITKIDQAKIHLVHRPFDGATKSLPTDILRKELERFIIELSWKSSKIEGNTYSLLDTEALILKNQKAAGHSDAEATMILNHKIAFDHILQNKDDFKDLTISHITQLHNILVKDMDITTGIRKNSVGITGTTYLPLDNQHQLKDALQNTVKIVNRTFHPVEKALTAHSMLPYIQAFTDGNKRTGRMLTNAILLAHDYFPLSYRSVDEDEFKKALILFYEQNSVYHVKRLFMDQLEFAYKTYFVK